MDQNNLVFDSIAIILYFHMSSHGSWCEHERTFPPETGRGLVMFIFIPNLMGFY